MSAKVVPRKASREVRRFLRVGLQFSEQNIGCGFILFDARADKANVRKLRLWSDDKEGRKEGK
jgi:hypothetical protein